MSKTILVYCDGGSRGNPGDAAIGCIIQNANLKIQNANLKIQNANLKMQNANLKMQNQNSKCKIVEISKFIGTATNNQAEYRAVIEALKSIIEMRNEKLEDTEIKFFLDSELVVEQLKGNYKVKNEGLKPLFLEVRELMMKLGGNVTFTHITRDKNKEADRLVNLALDKKSQILNPKS